MAEIKELVEASTLQTHVDITSNLCAHCLGQNASNRVASSANAKLHITRQQLIALFDRLEAMVGEDGAEVRARSKILEADASVVDHDAATAVSYPRQ